MTRLASLLLMLLLAANASGQDLPPERLDEISVRQQVVTLRGEGMARLWFNNGFGWFGFADANRPTIWREQPYLFTWFKIGNSTNGDLDDYWFCERSTWATYVANKDVAALKANSWHFETFVKSSSYTPPIPPDPVTWMEVTGNLSLGVASSNELIVIRKKDGTWEWTIRGTNGSDTYRVAASRDEAKTAAEAAL